MEKTNFDLYLEQELRDPKFAERFKQAGETWDVALQRAAQSEQTDLSPQQGEWENNRGLTRTASRKSDSVGVS